VRRLATQGPRRLLAVLITTVMVSAGGLSTPAEDEFASDTLVIATGGTSGVYDAYGRALADEIDAKLNGVTAQVEPTSGSVDNLRRLADGRADLAFSAADAAADANMGRAPFTEPVPLRALGRIYDDYLHLIVDADTPADDLADLRGRVISVGSEGSGTEVIAGRLLSLAGLEDSDLRAVHLGLHESVQALRQGRIDGFFWSGGIPTRGVTELMLSTRVRMIPLGTLALAMRKRYGAVYRRAVIPAGAYPETGQIATLAVPNYLVVLEGARSSLIYEVTRLLFTRREAIASAVPVTGSLADPVAIFTSPLLLHAGSLRYYREVKP
jgi:uncharacterized protein